MRKVIGLAVLTGAAAMAAGCASTKASGFGNRNAPNEFAVTRNPPLVVPPDFALHPPRPGAPRPMEEDASTQALQAMFGGTAQVSPGQSALVTQAGGAPDAGIRSDAADPQTDVVDKGKATQQIIAAPATNGQDATASTPQ